MQDLKKRHEQYHRNTHSYYKVIKKKNFTYRFFLDLFEKYIKSSSAILDIGCGAGALSIYLSKRGNRVFGIDVSKKAINMCITSAREIGIDNITFLQSDFLKFNVKEKFDVIIFTEVIEHLPNDVLALNKIHYLLKDKGTLILSTPSIHAPLHKLGLTSKFDREVGHLRRYALDDLKLLVANSGFRILEVKKSEGIIRNFLFINPLAGKLVRFLNYSSLFSDIATLIDNLAIRIFGESNYIIVARKISKKK